MIQANKCNIVLIMHLPAGYHLLFATIDYSLIRRTVFAHPMYTCRYAMMKNNTNDLNPGQIELTEKIFTDTANLPVIPESAKDIDPVHIKPRPRLKRPLSSYL